MTTCSRCFDTRWVQTTTPIAGTRRFHSCPCPVCKPVKSPEEERLKAENEKLRVIAAGFNSVLRDAQDLLRILVEDDSDFHIIYLADQALEAWRLFRKEEQKYEP